MVKKLVTCLVVLSHTCVFHSGSLIAEETAEEVSPQEEKARRQVYADKIRRLEADISSARGSRDLLVTAAVVSLFAGGGLSVGSEKVKSAVKDIPATDSAARQEINDAANAVGMGSEIGALVVIGGCATLASSLIYNAVIDSKQERIDALRAELDTKFAPKGLTPEYLRKNESVAVVVEEIEEIEEGMVRCRTMQSIFSKLGIGAIVSGAFLVGLSGVTETIVKDIDLGDAGNAGKGDALDETDSLAASGTILIGVGAASCVGAYVSGLRVRAGADRIDELENGLLRIADRINVLPSPDGFMLVYNQSF